MERSSQSMRTINAITNTFIALLKKKPFEKITVQDILDETPVTRATFYSYFHDKYEIVEKMHEQFFKIREDVRKELTQSSPEEAQMIIKKSAETYRDLLETLLKVRTEQLDLRNIIASNLENFYLQDAHGVSKQTEAKIYAQARTEAYLAFLYDEHMDYSYDYINNIYLAVALKLLKLSDDQETIDFLKQKLDLQN